MQAEQVILAQAVANAELMADRDQWRQRCGELERELSELRAASDNAVPTKDAPKKP